MPRPHGSTRSRRLVVLIVASLAVVLIAVAVAGAQREGIDPDEVTVERATPGSAECPNVVDDADVPDESKESMVCFRVHVPPGTPPEEIPQDVVLEKACATPDLPPSDRQHLCDQASDPSEP